MIGKRLGSYRLTEKLGEGGMGAVYAAEHEVIGKLAAVKVLRKHLCENDTVVARFFTEARATSAIRHPGIVEVFDFGHADDGTAYLVMELLEGESLKTRLRREGRLGSGDITRIGAQIARALEAAHARGITHRDLKPDNLFLIADSEVAGGERVKILDFGICKLSTDTAATVTRSGVVIGTPVYMAPEQCRGAGTVDHRADLYALGCILFEMACGERPFDDKGHGELIAKHMFTAADPVTRRAPEVPADLERVIARLLEKRPRDRYQSAAGVAAALDAIGAGEPLPAEEPPKKPPAPRRVHVDEVPTEHPTTIGGATGETRVVRPVKARPRRAWPVVVGVAAAAAAIAVAVGWTRRGGDATTSRAHEVYIDAGVEPVDASSDRDETEPGWVLVAPPAEPVLLGLTPDDGTIAPGTVGFHPSREIYAPSRAFSIQASEVTWAELDRYLDANPTAAVYRPAWAAGARDARAELAATGVPWRTAYEYCRSIAARLPTEAEWEYAARGAERRPYSWGAEQIDLARTRIYAGKNARIGPARSADQDRTPGDAGAAIAHLMGNAREWTADLWRENRPGLDESWVQTDDGVFRAIRGLPVAADPPARLPREGAAYRDALCAAEVCLRGHEDALAYVGFRCARDTR